jgi:hypothetical protein
MGAWDHSHARCNLELAPGGGNGAKPYAPSFFTAQMEDFLKDVATDYGQDPVIDPTY